jgi:hypothetical protein
LGDEKCIQIFIGKPEWKRQPGRPRRKWENYIRTYLTEVAFESVDRIHLPQERKWRRITVIKVISLLVE